VIGRILYQPQNTVADLAGTGTASRKRTTSTVRIGMLARCTMSMSYAVHCASRLRHPHAVALRHAEFSGHLPD